MNTLQLTLSESTIELILVDASFEVNIVQTNVLCVVSALPVVIQLELKDFDVMLTVSD